MNLQRIDLPDLGLVEIPSRAFRPINGYQNDLIEIALESSLSKIGSNAFFNLKYLRYLSLDIENLVSISDYAFEIEEYSDRIFKLTLYYNQNFSAFNEKTLLNMRRQTELRLTYEKTAYLEEKVFLPFLLDNKENTIEITAIDVFDCNESRNYWLKTNQYLHRRVNVQCSD